MNLHSSPEPQKCLVLSTASFGFPWLPWPHLPLETLQLAQPLKLTFELHVTSCSEASSLYCHTSGPPVGAPPPLKAIWIFKTLGSPPTLPSLTPTAVSDLYRAPMDLKRTAPTDLHRGCLGRLCTPSSARLAPVLSPKRREHKGLRRDPRSTLTSAY